VIYVLSSSASRLSKAYFCGKLAQPFGNIPDSDYESSESDFSEYQADGNIRHSIMEYYLQNIASKELSLDSDDMRALTKGEKWIELHDFLKEKNHQKKLGDISQLNCRKVMKKLRKTIKYLSNYFSKFGTITYIGAEVSLDTGSPIPVNGKVQVEKGEIDAVFVFKNENEGVTVCVVDWKRNLSNKELLIQYERQCQVYIRCILNKPSLIGLNQSQMESTKMVGYLVEIGGNEATKPEIVNVSTNYADIESFLDTAISRYNSSKENPGGHCSSWCKWAFANEYCTAIASESLMINFHSDLYWKNSENLNKWINSLVQFKVSRKTVLEIGGDNVMHFDEGRKLHLKGIHFHKEVDAGSILRIYGSSIRKTPTTAYLNVKELKLLS